MKTNQFVNFVLRLLYLLNISGTDMTRAFGMGTRERGRRLETGDICVRNGLTPARLLAQARA